MTRDPRAELLVALGAAFISFAAVFVRWIAPLGVGPTGIGFWRMLLGGLMLGAMAWRRGASFRTDGRSLAFTVLAGICFSCDLFVWHKSILTIGAGIATILANTQVFWVSAFGVLVLGEHSTWRL